MADQRDDRFLVEKPHALAGQCGDINERLGIGVLVDQGVGNVERAPGRVDDMHRTEVFVLRTDANDLLDDLDGVRILGVESCYKGIGLARLDHHHTEIVTLEHLVVSLLEGITLALALLCQNVGITLTTFLFRGMTQIDNLDTFDVQV